MTPVGYSDFVEAADEASAIATAMEALEARGITPFETPLYVEDLGDGSFEVVLRRRITDRPEPKTQDEAGDPDAIAKYFEANGLTLVK